LNLLSWIKGLLRKEKKVTYTTLRQKIKNYNKEEYKKYMELVKKKASVDKKYTRYF